ncbi:hypothetical protein LA76x_1625 [Lysobacter antibioticus]|uniref:Uncharacterized protein n=1 Tax=Lysobacter antibioticus TaxID=84531 RepID=A0A0S2F8A5_LYSAN|nr:hypothetical protein LA76x_1625 [Lysobacter antibioticus]
MREPATIVVAAGYRGVAAGAPQCPVQAVKRLSDFRTRLGVLRDRAGWHEDIGRALVRTAGTLRWRPAYGPHPGLQGGCVARRSCAVAACAAPTPSSLAVAVRRFALAKAEVDPEGGPQGCGPFFIGTGMSRMKNPCVCIARAGP